MTIPFGPGAAVLLYCTGQYAEKVLYVDRSQDADEKTPPTGVLVKLTVPVGTVGLVDVSVTKILQLVVAPVSMGDEVQSTVVVVVETARGATSP